MALPTNTDHLISQVTAMTWKTNNGKRILEGAEATVFASCLACMISEDVDDKGMNSNMPLVDGPFERLTPAQKYTVMEEVAQALFHESSIIPQLSAINESSIYYVFMWLLRRFESPELDGPKVCCCETKSAAMT